MHLEIEDFVYFTWNKKIALLNAISKIIYHFLSDLNPKGSVIYCPVKFQKWKQNDTFETTCECEKVFS